jgi:hypothetical protein
MFGGYLSFEITTKSRFSFFKKIKNHPCLGIFVFIFFHSFREQLGSQFSKTNVARPLLGHVWSLVKTREVNLVKFMTTCALR